MPDRRLPDSTTPTDPDEARVRFAAARADDHSVRELYLLELAVRTKDDFRSSLLELYAFEAFCDANAIAQEHELDV
jgi:hypothetical protein